MLGGGRESLAAALCIYQKGALSRGSHAERSSESSTSTSRACPIRYDMCALGAAPQVQVGLAGYIHSDRCMSQPRSGPVGGRAPNGRMQCVHAIVKLQGGPPLRACLCLCLRVASLKRHHHHASASAPMAIIMPAHLRPNV